MEKDPASGLVHLALELAEMDGSDKARASIRIWHQLTRELFSRSRPTPEDGEQAPADALQLAEKAFEVLADGGYGAFFSPEKGLDKEQIRGPFISTNRQLVDAPYLGHLSFCKGDTRSFFVSFLRAYSHTYFGHQIGMKPNTMPARTGSRSADREGRSEEPQEKPPPRLKRDPRHEKWWVYLHGFGTTQLVGDEQKRYCMGYLHMSTNWMTAAHDSFVIRCQDTPPESGKADQVFRAHAVNTIIPVPSLSKGSPCWDSGPYQCRLITTKNASDVEAAALLSSCFSAWDAAGKTYKPLYREALDLVEGDPGRYHLTDLGGEFEAAGLHRSRGTLTVTRDGELVMWGNLEQASPSLNATGMFDCLKLFYPADILGAEPYDLWRSGTATMEQVLRDAHRLLVNCALGSLQELDWIDTRNRPRRSGPTAINVIQDCVQVDDWLPRSLCEGLDLIAPMPPDAGSATGEVPEQKVDKHAKPGLLWIIHQSLVPDFLEHVAAATCPEDLL